MNEEAIQQIVIQYILLFVWSLEHLVTHTYLQKNQGTTKQTAECNCLVDDAVRIHIGADLTFSPWHGEEVIHGRQIPGTLRAGKNVIFGRKSLAMVLIELINYRKTHSE